MGRRFTLGHPVFWRPAHLLFALGLALAANFGVLPGVFGWQLEASIHDALVRHLAVERPETRLLIVDIDESSLQSIGPWPWPRGRLADLAEILMANYGARAVGFDIVLPEPGEATADARLSALAKSGRLVLAQAFDFVPRLPAILVGQPAAPLAAPPPLPAMAATGLVGNHAGLAGARCAGNIGFVPDPDGQYRHQPLLVSHEGATYAALAVALLACPKAGIPLGELLAHQEVTSDGAWTIPFLRTQSSYVSVPAGEILAGTLPADMVAGRIVIVGSTALGLGDRVATPLDANTAGVLVHAQSFSALLDGLESKPGKTSLALLWFGWALLSTIAVWASVLRGRALWQVFATTCVALGGWLFLSQQLVSENSGMPVSAPLWAYAALLLLLLPVEWAWSQKRAQMATQLLSRYVAQPVLTELMQIDPESVLAPALREITVLIADMQDYTQLTAFSSLEESAALTKDFLDHLTRPVLEHGGTLDKYTGDGLVAFWGAPLPVADHASRAIAAARAILERIRLFNERREKAGQPPAHVRIGIASGRALVGDLGTPFRSTYTAVGDCINMASRLEAMAKDLGVATLVAEGTTRLCPEIRFVSLGEVSLRGLKEPEVVFTLGTD